MNKRGSIWTWILLIIFLIIVIAVIYVQFFKGGDFSSIIPGGNSIPKPPALPG